MIAGSANTQLGDTRFFAKSHQTIQEAAFLHDAEGAEEGALRRTPAPILGFAELTAADGAVVDDLFLARAVLPIGIPMQTPLDQRAEQGRPRLSHPSRTLR